MKRFILLIFAGFFTVIAFGQNERKFVRSGNKYFMEAVKDTTRLDTLKFGQAEEEYRKALNLRPGTRTVEF
jgi:Ca-activated chloride channel homolog